MDCTSITQSYGEREDDTPKYSQIYYKSMTDNTSSNSDSKINVDSLFKVFTDSNVVIIIWFLVVYFVVYLLLNIFRGKDGVRNSLSRWVDIVSLLLALTYLVFTYFGKSDEEKKEIIADLYSNFKTYLNSPLSIISAAFFIFTLYIVIYILEIHGFVRETNHNFHNRKCCVDITGFGITRDIFEICCGCVND